MKICFKCQIEKFETEFYAHKNMADGLLGKCKQCTKSDVQKNYYSNRMHYVRYEKRRFNDTNRKKKVAEYQRKRRRLNPEKYKAHSMVHNAVRDGKLFRKPCEICGEIKTQAHHDDYSKPLDVRWLCFKHHRENGHNQIVT